jgi:hypothetical protein
MEIVRASARTGDGINATYGLEILKKRSECIVPDIGHGKGKKSGNFVNIFCEKVRSQIVR